MGYTMGYICQKLWDIYIRQKLRRIMDKSMGYLWDIIDKFLNNWIY